MPTSFNGGLGMESSYYLATANPSPATRPLHGIARADVVVVGAGCTGLAAARYLACQGRSVILIEGGEVGWGASGRNGGQMIPGLRLGAAQLVKRYGAEHGRRLFKLSVSARDEVLGLINDEGIKCDLKRTGHLSAAIKESDLDDMRREVECLHTIMDYSDAAILEKADTRREVATDYVGGLLDRGGGHLHPLNYTLGLAEAAINRGVTIHCQSPAKRLDRTGSGVTVHVPGGRVIARHCILAGDALLAGLDSSVTRHIMPIASYIAATRPLNNSSELISADRAISDSRFVVNYFRLSADGRLLFGGGERYTRRPPTDIAEFVRPFMERTFPQLTGTPIDHAWGGLVSVTRTRLPHIGRDGPVLWAHGYSGMGTILSSLAGSVLAKAIDGDDVGLDLFQSISPPAFPGGGLLRGPLHTLAMLWYATRDRLGV